MAIPDLLWNKEAARLQELHRYQVLDTEPEVAFGRIVGLAQRFYNVPTVLISLVAEEKQWFKASVGLDMCETGLESSFCVYAIKQDEVMVVPDARQDVRFCDMPLVTGDPFIRFYAGAPLKTSSGHNLGTLCLIDSVPHDDFSDASKQNLSDLAAMVVDELELRLASQNIQRQMDTLRIRDQALAAVGVGISIADARHPDYPLIDCNPAFEKLTGYTREEVIGRNCRFLAGSETNSATRHEIRTALRDKRSCRVIIKNYRKNQSSFWNELTLSPVIDSTGTVSHYIGIQANVTERKRVETQLERFAYYDSTTGLPNRRLYDDRLSQAAAQSRRNGKSLSVMLLDLDNFKHVNDTHGHGFGDRLLQEVATRLSYSVREGDTLARWGGDEFALILSDVGDVCEVTTLAERLLEQLRQPFLMDGREFSIGASLGIDVCPNGLAVATELVKNADIALYRAKATRGSYQFFSERMREQLRIRVELGEELRTALEKDALTLHYQPRVDLVTGEIVGLEALARWSHPTKGWVPPSTFIPLAEELGLIQKLGAQMLDKACAQAKLWEQANLACRVAVNLSVEQLKLPNILEEVKATLRRHHLAAELLELEITESTAMTDVEASIEKLRQFRDMGVHIAIDDFGTAYSSLAYLNRLPIDSLKIDRAFINDLAKKNTADEGGVAIVQAILALGKSLNLRVVAEGVENEVQGQILRQLGCDEGQGYLFSRPLEALAIEPLLLCGVLGEDAYDRV